MPRKGGRQAAGKVAELMGKGLGTSSRSGTVNEDQLAHNAAILMTAPTGVKAGLRLLNQEETGPVVKHVCTGQSSLSGYRPHGYETVSCGRSVDVEVPAADKDLMLSPSCPKN